MKAKRSVGLAHEEKRTQWKVRREYTTASLMYDLFPRKGLVHTWSVPNAEEVQDERRLQR